MGDRRKVIPQGVSTNSNNMQQQLTPATALGNSMNVINLTRLIISIANDLSANVQSCKDLATRITSVEATLTQLQSLENNPNFVKIIADYNNALTAAEAFLKIYSAIQQKGYLKKNFENIYHKNEHKASFANLNSALSMIEGQLNTALHLQHNTNNVKLLAEIAQLKGALPTPS